MANLLYALLLILTGSAIGAALFGTYATIRIMLLGGRKKILTYASTLLIGVSITQGTLLYALIQAGQATPSGRAWFYTLGLVIQSMGLIGAAKVAIDKLADIESAITQGENGD